MTYTPEEIAEIVRETVTNSAKDLKNIAEIIRLTALVTQELKDILQGDPEVNIDMETDRGGLTQQKALAWQAAVILKERSQT